jgi:C4-dicarboxylate-specific signal transduction histidine kinase
VRSRYLSWVDGRLAQMVIATDITPRRLAEEQSARQTERAQSVSRLITMGEMASSVAHELNQPLTAISNYCSGIISRIRSGNITEEALLTALEKTAHQAQRAGQIIQRIRDFVKKSAPNRQLADVPTMVSEAVELAEIELRRHNVRLTHYVAARLPQVMADSILIEQVLINLMKNGAESIAQAQRPRPTAVWSCAWCRARWKARTAWSFPCRTPARACPKRCRTGCSRPSSRPRPKAWAWV